METIEINKDLFDQFSEAIGERDNEGSTGYFIVVPYSSKPTGDAIERDLKGWSYVVVKADR